MDDTNQQKKRTAPATCVKFSEQEYAMISRMRQTTGKSFPDLLKQALFRRVDLARPLLDKESVEKIMVELRRQGNNINQIAKQINSGTMTGWSQSFNALVRGYFEIRQLVSVNRGNS